MAWELIRSGSVFTVDRIFVLLKKGALNFIWLFKMKIHESKPESDSSAETDFAASVLSGEGLPKHVADGAASGFYSPVEAG